MKNHKRRRKHIRKNEEGGGEGVDDTVDKKGGMTDSRSLQEY